MIFRVQFEEFAQPADTAASAHQRVFPREVLTHEVENLPAEALQIRLATPADPNAAMAGCRWRIRTRTHDGASGRAAKLGQPPFHPRGLGFEFSLRAYPGARLNASRRRGNGAERRRPASRPDAFVPSHHEAPVAALRTKAREAASDDLRFQGRRPHSTGTCRWHHQRRHLYARSPSARVRASAVDASAITGRAGDRATARRSGWSRRREERQRQGTLLKEACAADPELTGQGPGWRP